MIRQTTCNRRHGGGCASRSHVGTYVELTILIEINLFIALIMP
jgi:hypothetical protein